MSFLIPVTSPCTDVLQSSVLKEMTNIFQMLSFSCPLLCKQCSVLFGKVLFLFLMYMLLSLYDWGGKFRSTSCTFSGRCLGLWMLLFPVGAGCQNYLPQHYVVTCKDIIPGIVDVTSRAGTLGLLAEIVGEKIMSKYQRANQSQPLIFFHTNHFCLIRYNFPSVKLHKFQEQVRN